MYKIINKKKLAATIVADAIGNVLYAPVRLMRGFERPSPDEVRSILVIRTAYIGDAVMTIPVLKPLRDHFKNARITFLTSHGAAPIIGADPNVDEVIAYDPFWFYPSPRGDYRTFMAEFGRREFDLVIEARADIRELLMLVRPLKARWKVSYDVGGGGYLLDDVVPYPGLKHKVQYHLDIARHIGAPVDGVHWDVHLGDEVMGKVDGILRAEGITGDFICAHPGTRLPLKMWRHEGYAEAYDMLIERYGMPLVLFGTGDEQPMVDDIVGRMRRKPISLAGRLNLMELGGTIKRSRCFICNDSAPMHMAAAMGIPTVAIFGPSKSVETGPYGEIHRVVEREFPCRHTCDEGTCKYERHHACMLDIEVKDVVEAAASVLEGR